MYLNPKLIIIEITIKVEWKPKYANTNINTKEVAINPFNKRKLNTKSYLANKSNVHTRSYEINENEDEDENEYDNYLEG